MSLERPYQISSPDVVAEDFGSEIVVLNLANGKYFSLIGIAASLWRDITGGHPPQALIDQLLSTKNLMSDAVRAFALTLISEQLIRPAENALASSPASAASSLTGIELITDPPKLQAYDDMAELILADPIHDVEEDIGWPVKRSPD